MTYSGARLSIPGAERIFFLSFFLFLFSHVVTLQRSETFYPWSGAALLSFFPCRVRGIFVHEMYSFRWAIFRGVVFLFAWLLPGAYTIPAELRGLLYIETAYIETYYTETETETVETADIID